MDSSGPRVIYVPTDKLPVALLAPTGRPVALPCTCPY